MTEQAQQPSEALAIDDPLREQLLDAASSVFASKGFDGTKTLDIVRAAGLSAGAIYGRFESKNELLIASVVRATIRAAEKDGPADERVADLLNRRVAEHRGPLGVEEALKLEAYVAARREPEVAAAVAEARKMWRETIKPLIEQAMADGTTAPDLDMESVLYFIQTIHLGILVQRGAGIEPPAKEQWLPFIARIISSLATSPAAPPPRTRRKRA